MNKEFQWVVHTTRKGNKQNEEKPNFSRNERLPFEYRGNDNFDLELKLYENGKMATNYKKNELKISKSSAKIVENNKTISHSYFENSVWWIIKASFTRSFEQWKRLVPLVLWSILLTIVLFIGNKLASSDLTIAVTLLINENASKVTILIANLAFIFFSFLFVSIPKKWKLIESFFKYISEQFFGLVIGAAAFSIASVFMIMIAEGQSLTNENIIDLAVIIVISLLTHFCHSYYIELNEILDKKGRWGFRVLSLLAAAISIYALKHT